MKPKSFLIVVALAGAPSLLPAQTPVLAGECFRFDRHYFRWPARRSQSGGLVRDSTNLIRLLSDTYAGPLYPGVAGARKVTPVPFGADSGAAGRWLARSYWYSSGADSVGIAWRNGFSGPVFRMHVRGDTLRGLVTFTTDVKGLPERVEDAIATRILCPG